MVGSQHLPDAWVSTVSPLSRGVSIAPGRAALPEWRALRKQVHRASHILQSLFQSPGVAELWTQALSLGSGADITPAQTLDPEGPEFKSCLGHSHPESPGAVLNRSGPRVPGPKDVSKNGSHGGEKRSQLLFIESLLCARHCDNCFGCTLLFPSYKRVSSALQLASICRITRGSDSGREERSQAQQSS